jgi:hypothetical protein
VHIAVFASTDSGQVGDCETGDMTPQQAPGWVAMRRAAGQDPTVYHSFNGWGAVRDQFTAQGVPEPWWWIADYGITPQLFTADDLGRPTDRCVAHQYADPSITGHPYDESLAIDFWAGVDPVPTPQPPRGGNTVTSILYDEPLEAQHICWVRGDGQGMHWHFVPGASATEAIPSATGLDPLGGWDRGITPFQGAGSTNAQLHFFARAQNGQGFHAWINADLSDSWNSHVL